MQARLAFRTSKQHRLCHTNHRCLLFARLSHSHKEQPLFPDHFLHINTRLHPPPPFFFLHTCSLVVYSSALIIILSLLQPQLFHWMTECSPCSFPLPPSFSPCLSLAPNLSLCHFNYSQSNLYGGILREHQSAKKVISRPATQLWYQ